MKKKGLIVATIVMVLVLAVSLTTATYAWFTADAKAAVTPISFSVAAGSDVLIGVAKDNVYVEHPGDTNFVSNTGIDYAPDTNKWSNGTEGLGHTVDTGLSLADMTQAIWTGVPGTSVDPKTTWDTTTSGHVVIKANGENMTVNNTSAVKAVANGGLVASTETRGDYLDVCFGVTAAVDNLTGIYCVVAVKPDTAKTTTLGMNAAITLRYQIDGGDWVQEEIYEDYHYNNKYANMEAPEDTVSTMPTGTTWSAGDGYKEILIANTGLEQGTIHQIHIIAFINGWDDDCIASATGVASTISINFTTTKPAVTPGT